MVIKSAFPIISILLEFVFGILGILLITYLLYLHKIPYDLKVEGMLFFFWAVLNITSGIFNIVDGRITTQTYVSIGIGFITLIIASYKYWMGGRVHFRTLKNGRKQGL
jgi:hypothetical protein